jgi:hypothetical protein
MSAELKRLFPEGLRHAKAERGKPRHKPPLRFVPTKAPEAEDGVEIKEKLITVKLTDDTTMKVFSVHLQQCRELFTPSKASPVHLGPTRCEQEVEQDGTNYGRS